MNFSSVEDIRKAVVACGITQHKAIKCVHNDWKRVKARCQTKGVNGKDCDCMVYASVERDSITYRVKTFIDKHTCGGKVFNNPKMTSKWLAKKYVS